MISKLSNIHFVCHDEYKKFDKLGEKSNEEYLIMEHQVLKIYLKKFQINIRVSLKRKLFLVTYHPNTIHPKKTKIEIIQLMEALKYLRNYNFILSQPNLDINSHEVSKIIKKYKKYKERNYKKIFR